MHPEKFLRIGPVMLCYGRTLWRVVDPRGMQISSNVMSQHDGSLRVEFVPVTVGEYHCSRAITAKFHYRAPTGPDQTKSADFVGDSGLVGSGPRGVYAI